MIAENRREKQSHQHIFFRHQKSEPMLAFTHQIRQSKNGAHGRN